MNAAGIELHVLNYNQSIRLEIVTPGLFAGLVLQLVSTISSVSGFAICSCCGEIYVPTRHPRAGIRRYCSDTCRKQAGVDAVRRYRERQRPNFAAGVAVRQPCVQPFGDFEKGKNERTSRK